MGGVKHTPNQYIYIQLTQQSTQNHIKIKENYKMATNRPTGFGLSRELAEKNAAKYSVDDEVPFPLHY